MRITDPTGYSFECPERVNTIISTVPSQTELLYDLGLGDKVPAHTLFCVHPKAAFKSKPKIGGTKNLKLEKIAAFEPDLIIANKEENEKEEIQWLRDRFPVWTSDVKTVDDGLNMIGTVGKLTQTTLIANELAEKIKRQRENFLCVKNKPKVLYLIWKKPWMSVGGDTFIHHMLAEGGFENVLTGKTRYPEISNEFLSKCDADDIFLSSEPYPFREKHQKELTALTGKKVHLVDGEIFSWYGSRMQKAFSYLEQLHGRTSI